MMFVYSGGEKFNVICIPALQELTPLKQLGFGADRLQVFLDSLKMLISLGSPI